MQHGWRAGFARVVWLLGVMPQRHENAAGASVRRMVPTGGAWKSFAEEWAGASRRWCAGCGRMVCLLGVMPQQHENAAGASVRRTVPAGRTWKSSAEEGAACGAGKQSSLPRKNPAHLTSAERPPWCALHRKIRCAADLLHPRAASWAESARCWRRPDLYIRTGQSNKPGR